MADLIPVPTPPVASPDKHILLSKTIWINVLGLIAIFVPSIHTFMVNQPEVMLGIFTVVNMLLRLVTKGAVYFDDGSGQG